MNHVITDSVRFPYKLTAGDARTVMVYFLTHSGGEAASRCVRAARRELDRRYP